MEPHSLHDRQLRDLVQHHDRQAAPLRRDRGCEYTDRIELGIVTESEELHRAVKRFADYIQSETLCARLTDTPLAADREPLETKVAGHNVLVYLQTLKS